MCTARVTIWTGRVNIIQPSLPFPLKLSSSPLGRGWLEAFLLWPDPLDRFATGGTPLPDPLDPFVTGGTPLSVRDPFTASGTLVTPEVDAPPRDLLAAGIVAPEVEAPTSPQDFFVGFTASGVDALRLTVLPTPGRRVTSD
jgi:hypothetical protein